jgi:DNA repair protein RecO (recombination protein O)
MDWTDEAVVIGLRRHGETGVIVELLTRQRGRHLGFVHGGRSRRLRPVLQQGNSVHARWQARTEDLLGTMVLEALDLRAARLMATALSLQAVNLLCSLARLLPERQTETELFDLLQTILDQCDDRSTAPAAVVHFELAVLRELGFGLDLDRCAVTGRAEGLAYVSPKTGRAVSLEAGHAYRDRILALPSFLLEDRAPIPGEDDLRAGFALTEHFLMKHVYGPQGRMVPDCRRAYVAAVFATEQPGAQRQDGPSAA